jgi:hypothetical protein
MLSLGFTSASGSKNAECGISIPVVADYQTL